MARPIDCYKVLVMLYTQEYPWLKRLGDGYVEIRFRELQEKLGCYKLSLQLCFKWLVLHGYITEFSQIAGWSKMRVLPPQLITKEYGFEQADQKYNA
jgi:hypothetical protein